MLFPNETATLSPFFTPSFCRPLASLLESRSSASYVRIVRWWCDITLLDCQHGSPFELVPYALRSPYCRTTPAKCSGTVCSSNGGYRVRQLFQFRIEHACSRTSFGPAAKDLVRRPRLVLQKKVDEARERARTVRSIFSPYMQ
jgi:hypothetical protein